MVTFLASMASPRVVLVPEYEELIQIEGGQHRRKRIRGLTVEFEAIPGGGYPYYGNNLVTKGGKVRGKFETKDPKTISLMMEHKRYGLDFVAVSEDGRELAHDDYLFLPQSDGTVVFLPTGRIFKSMAGAKGFKQSAEYKEEAEKFIENARLLLNK